MTLSRSLACCTVLALAACAEGFADATPAQLAQSMQPTGAGAAGGAAGGAGSAAAAGATAAGTNGVVLSGEPCMQGMGASCPCEGLEAMGSRMCVFDATSPLDGFLSECQGCPPPPVDPAVMCSDGMKNGYETGMDCGGHQCDPCAIGGGCAMDADCADSVCTGGTCTMRPVTPPPAGTSGGGSGGSSGGGGDSGSGGGSTQQPVSDCRGEDEGTPCDRSCILPTNTARCNLFGICSCL